MQKRSVLTKIIILVLLAFIIPSAFADGSVACYSPVCTESCPVGTVDCTNSWGMLSWDNFYTLLGMYMNGISPLVCCFA
jgi:hypothetical protein